ncbi:hypothetical protein [Paenibacillus spongiae]|uniref:Uncharacterized protein n=1 Tax=Paenibacillus spongiae TaxID=2909671 RepID=A0ABY5SEF3_9BACL|nr:hypothetical protein [Paenibacillus spongiae]UVI31068.1 hypothetical protein L1F29_04215 [Paenibacillus spongiae]
MEYNPRTFTLNYLKYCYTCQDAHLCLSDTESKCIACWEEKNILKKEEAAPVTTEELLRKYAE